MGCNQSTSVTAKKRRPNGGPPIALTSHERSQRIESIKETRACGLGGISVRYAYLSQRGYYPDDQNKANQDSYSVTHDFAGQTADAFFGVYDGHGRDGDKCAQFVRDTLPTLLAEGMTKARENNDGAELTKERKQAIILNAHRECNMKRECPIMLHSQDDFDDSLSGTTSISVYLHGNTNRITVSNVGDSRTIIGRQMQTSEVENGSSSSGGALKAFALSRDQTPYRRDERVRIRRTGGRILSLDQIEGLEPIREDEKERDEKALMNGGGEDIILGEEIDESGDPPRVWSPNGDYPGTAFTRSIGDAIAEELGVHADPEMLSRELTPEDKIIVIASDGVFEFLTNQSVIDICAKFSDPLEACRAVVAESYELWLQYELRTDDITIICLFLDSVDASKILRGPLALSTTEMVGESLNKDDALVSGSTRPVRKNISLEKSRALEKMKAEMNSVHDVTTETEEDFDMEALFNEKTEEEKTCIAEAIRASVVFQKITNSQRELLYKVMEPMKVKAGQWIIKQGTLGDRFYIVQFGTFEVRIVSEGAEDAEGTGGNVVHVYEGSREKDQHPCFGELALMYSTPRAASIIAKTDGMLWALHRFAFKKVTAERGSREGAVEILKKIDQLKGFSPDGLEDLASYLCEAKYAKGDVLIRQGEVGESIFVMLPGGGAEDLVQTKEDGSDERTLSDNDYFGEEILEMRSQKRYGSTVKATGKISCWTLSRSDVKRASRRSSKE